MVTIKQIAQKTGVSPSTVSNVLHDREYKMTEETLEKIRKVIRETQYVPNMGGRILRNKKSQIIGVIISHKERDTINLFQYPFYSEIIGVMEKIIRNYGYFMMLYTAANIEESLQIARAWNIDGLIMMGCQLNECSKIQKNTSIPLVFIDSYFIDDGLPYTCVGLEDRQGGYLMVKHLIEKGHRNICFFSNEVFKYGVYYERYCGCKQAMEEAGLPFGDEHYKIIPIDNTQMSVFLENFINKEMHRYSVLFFANDSFALNAISCFADKGIRIPDDISLCGFDGDAFSLLYRPKLTTVQQNVSEKGVYAVNMLMKLIRKEHLEQRIIRLNVSIRDGESVKNYRH